MTTFATTLGPLFLHFSRRADAPVPRNSHRLRQQPHSQPHGLYRKRPTTAHLRARHRQVKAHPVQQPESLSGRSVLALPSPVHRRPSSPIVVSRGGASPLHAVDGCILVFVFIYLVLCFFLSGRVRVKTLSSKLSISGIPPPGVHYLRFSGVSSIARLLDGTMVISAMTGLPGQWSKPPLATKNLLEDTDELRRPP